MEQLPNLDIVTVDRASEIDEQKDKENQDHIPLIVDIEDISGVEELPAEVQGLWHNWSMRWLQEMVEQTGPIGLSQKKERNHP